MNNDLLLLENLMKMNPYSYPKPSDLYLYGLQEKFVPTDRDINNIGSVCIDVKGDRIKRAFGVKEKKRKKGKKKKKSTHCAYTF